VVFFFLRVKIVVMMLEDPSRLFLLSIHNDSGNRIPTVDASIAHAVAAAKYVS